MSPDTLKRCKGKTSPRWPDNTPAPYALDNGAWGCFKRDQPFDVQAFLWAFERVGAEADWVVAPDIVGRGRESLELTRAWLPKLQHRLTLIAVQDGMTPADIDELMTDSRGVFVGGSTDWKLSTLPMWGDYCRSAGRYLHVARVNTIKRFSACRHFGAHSIDGSSASRFAVTADLLPSTLKQTTLFGA